MDNNNQPGIAGPYRRFRNVNIAQDTVYEDHDKPRALWVKGTAAAAKIVIAHSDQAADKVTLNLPDNAPGEIYHFAPKMISSDTANVEVVALS